jgi:hypothetical protein
MADNRKPTQPSPDSNAVLGKALGTTDALAGNASPLANALRAHGAGRAGSPQPTGENEQARLNQGIGSLLEEQVNQPSSNPGALDPSSPLHNTLGAGILSLLAMDEYKKQVVVALRNSPKKLTSTLLHRKIRAARLAAGFNTQTAFAEALKCSHGAVSQWESDDPEKRTTPDMHWILRISLATGLPPGWLIDDQFANVHDAATYRTLNLAGRYHTIPVQMPGTPPGHWPNTGPNYESATVLDGVGVYLHDSNDQTDPADRRKHLRPAEIAFRGVEVHVASHSEELFDHFNQRIQDLIHADYFDGRNFVAFVHLRDKSNLWSLRRQIGEMLFVEAMLGKPLRKMILAWGASDDPPESFLKALNMGDKTKVHMAYFTRAESGAKQMLDFLQQQ